MDQQTGNRRGSKRKRWRGVRHLSVAPPADTVLGLVSAPSLRRPLAFVLQMKGGMKSLGGQSSPLQLPRLLQLFDPAARNNTRVTTVNHSKPQLTQSQCYLCLQRRRNLMIFLAAWSCFLVRNEPLMDTQAVPDGER